MVSLLAFFVSYESSITLKNPFARLCCGGFCV